MTAAMVLTNLLYVLGAVVGATLVSALVLLRHRRPKSLESGIESFSRELKALQPEHGQRAPVRANRVVPTGASGGGEFRPDASRAARGQPRRRAGAGGRPSRGAAPHTGAPTGDAPRAVPGGAGVGRGSDGPASVGTTESRPEGDDSRYSVEWGGSIGVVAPTHDQEGRSG